MEHSEVPRVSTSDKLDSILSAATKAAFPQLSNPPAALALPCESKFGDYQCNVALHIAQLLRKDGRKSPAPAVIASQIVASLPVQDIIGQWRIAPRGFINIDLAREYVANRLASVMSENFPPPLMPSKRVIVDMSSTNAAKEMHVGHLRSTIIGEACARLLQFCGHSVLKLNHVGDWGTPFGMLVAHLKESFAQYREEMPPIADLQAFYKAAKLRFDNDADFKRRAYQAVVELQSHDADALQAWRQICQVSRTECRKIHERLGITDLVERGESFYQEHMKEIVEELGAKGLLQEDEGRKIFFPNGCSIPLTLVKSDGGFTYDTSDLAALKHRIEVERAQVIHYVIDNGQRLHMETVFKAAEQIGWLDTTKVRCHYVGHGLVLGEDGKKIKTRSGDSVLLADLLDEGLARSAAKLREKRRDAHLTADEFARAQRAIAYGCIKYADLSHNRNNDYHFSFDRMLDDKGNTCAYLLYAYTRICSILRSLPPSDPATAASLDIGHERELELAKCLIRYDEMLKRLAEHLQLHQLCEYLYELATRFTEFYDRCYVIERHAADDSGGTICRVNASRVRLCMATAVLMRRCFDILGIETIEKM